MKNNLLLIICLLATIASFGQDDEQYTDYEYFPNQHIVKLNPLSFTFGKLSLGYEYVLENNKTAAIQIGVPIPAELNDTVLEELESDSINLNDTELKGFSIRPSYRMYLSSKKRGPRGIYFEPSLKYQNFELNADGSYTDTDTNEKYDTKTTSKVSTFGAGAQLGAQWLVSDAFAIDFFFLGPEINFGSFETTVNHNGAIPLSERADLKKEIEDTFGDLPLVGDVEVTTNDKDIKAESSNSTIPGLRFGIQFGYSF